MSKLEEAALSVHSHSDGIGTEHYSAVLDCRVLLMCPHCDFFFHFLVCERGIIMYIICENE